MSSKRDPSTHKFAPPPARAIQKRPWLGRFLNRFPQDGCFHSGSSGLYGANCDLAGSSIFLGVERNLLTLAEAAHSGTLQRGGVNKHILAAAIRLDEAEALLIIIEFHSSGSHRIAFFAGAADLVERAILAS